MDAPLYTVLSRLSHTHPWTSLILDLKDLMPDLDRHYHHQLLVAMLQSNPPHTTPYIVVDQFLYSLALTITNILTPPNSQVDPPEIDSFFFHPTFWHRHLIHGTNLASPSFFDASLVDTLAGNQLCQWSTVGAAEGRGTHQKDALLLASHLPPRVGAYVLASHPDLAKITSDTTGSENNPRSQFQVRQNAQFRSPQHLAQPKVATDAAREFFLLFFSCIAERVRDIVGQQLEVRKREGVTPWNKHAKSNCKRTVPFGNKAVKPQKLHSSGWNKPATQSPLSTAPSAKGAVSQVKRSVPLVPGMTNLHHPIGRATDIRTPQVIYRACQCRVHTLRSFICDHVGEPTHSDGPLTPICGGGWIYNFSIVGKKDSFIDGVV